jgi:hypothetical protein
MKITTTQKITAGLMLGALTLAANANVAHADIRGGRGGDRDWHGHEVRSRGYWHGHYVRDPGVVYAPPVVYEPPPEPVSSGINLIVPLHIR